MRFIYFFSFSLAASVHCFQSYHKMPSLQLLTVKSTLEHRNRSRNRKRYLFLFAAVTTKSRATNRNSSLNSSQSSPDMEELYRQAMEEDTEWFHTYIAPKLEKEKDGVIRKTFTRDANEDDSRVRENNDIIFLREPKEGKKDLVDETKNVIVARARQPTLSVEDRMESYERKVPRARFMNDVPKDPIYTDEQLDKQRQQQELPRPTTRRRRRMDSDDLGVLDQESNQKVNRRDTDANTFIDQQQRHRRKEKKPAHEELTGTRFWPGLRPFKDALKSELYLRASILDLFGGRKLKQPLKMEGKMRYQIYSSWLKLLKNGIGEPILDLDYEKDRMLRKSTSKKRNYGEENTRRKRRNTMGEEEVRRLDTREGLRTKFGRNPGDIISDGSRRFLARERDLEYSRLRDNMDDK